MNVAALIPAYNEERTIRHTIHVLQHVPEINEIIVVNDGSQDRTAEIVAEELGVILVNLPENRGKGGAIRAGVDRTNAEVILLLDADLIGLSRQHVTDLLAPVTDGRAQTTMGVFSGGRPMTDFAQKIAPKLSGQRAILRNILNKIDIADARYGVEVAINLYLEDHNIDIYEVELANLTHHTKEEKLGLLKGVTARVVMYYDVVKILLGRDR
ncbi:MAG: glycosyltransferase family 2 protein [bacterium]